MGWDVINMTAYPEGYLARELELCYANISMVTDHDVGVAAPSPSRTDGARVFTENNERLRELLFAAIPRIGQQPDDACASALQGARGPERLRADRSTAAPRLVIHNPPRRAVSALSSVMGGRPEDHGLLR